MNRTKPSRSSGTEAYELLLEAIENGALPPGTRLRESELATRFGISRTPVREALKSLETLGLVQHELHHGAVVASLDYEQMRELYHVREVLEGEAARLAATHATQTEIEMLQEMVEQDRKRLVEGIELSQSNKLFHHQIWLSARNRFLADYLDKMRIPLAMLVGTPFLIQHRGVETIDEHEKICTAIAKRDASAAERAARLHISNGFRVRISLLRTGKFASAPAGRKQNLAHESGASAEDGMSDLEWSLVASLVLDNSQKRGRPSFDKRRSLDGIFWIARTGAAWRDLPAIYGSWNSVHRQHRRWSSARLWRRMGEALNRIEPTVDEVVVAKQRLTEKLEAVQLIVT